MFEEQLAWFRDHPEVIESVLIFSAVIFVGSLIVLPILVAKIPADYFAYKYAPMSVGRAKHPLIRLMLLAIRNVVGVLLLLAGLLMLVTPGQGILTILVGLSLMTFPGKRKLEITIVRRPSVLRALNWVRSKAGKEPLQVLAKSAEEPAD